MLDDRAELQNAGPNEPEAPSATKPSPSPSPSSAPAPARWGTAWLSRLRWHRQSAAIALLMAGPVAIISVNVYLIQSGPSQPPEMAERFGDRVHAAAAAVTAAATVEPTPPPAESAEPTSPPEEEAPTKSKRDRAGAGRAQTVYQASSRSCSTASVDGLTRQIIAQARCDHAGAFAAVPARPNLVTASHVLLYLEAQARDHLLRALAARPDHTMRVHSALRTVAQQFLLSRWGREKRCGIQLAALPGESNHETGLALDISDPGDWRPVLEREGFQWMGAIDRVHFDYPGAGAKHSDGLDVLAFQQLWNQNHPDDRISETGKYSAATEERIKKSPAGGFANSPKCARSRP